LCGALASYSVNPPGDEHSGDVHWTFIERSPRVYTRMSGVRRDHREREHVQARERSRAWTSRTFARHSWTSPERFPDARFPDVCERIFFTYLGLLTYLLANVIGPTDLFLYIYSVFGA